MAKMKSQGPIQETEAHFGYLKGTCKWAKILEPNQFGSYSIDIYPEADAMETHIEMFEELRGKARIEIMG